MAIEEAAARKTVLASESLLIIMKYFIDPYEEIVVGGFGVLFKDTLTCGQVEPDVEPLTLLTTDCSTS